MQLYSLGSMADKPTMAMRAAWIVTRTGQIRGLVVMRRLP